MKRTNIVALLTALLALTIVATGAFSTNVLASSSKRLDNHVGFIEKNIQGNHWDKAETSVDSFMADWAGTEKTWAILLDHMEIDNIESSISKMSKYIKSKDTALALGEVSLLRQHIKHIPEKESFSLKNLL